MAENNNSSGSYNHNPKERCWYDDCNCPDILVSDCEKLVEENNKGVGRFACMAEEQTCYSPRFFSGFMKKLTCQLDHLIQNICGLWDIVTCLSQYLRTLGDVGTTKTIYLRNSAVSSSDFYHNITDEYDLDIYMDSTTGYVAGESDDLRRTLTDRKYRAFVRWCADGNNLAAEQDNTMEFTLYTNAEQYNEDMKVKRGIHWQMKGVTDGAMEMSDSVIIEKGHFLRLRVTPANSQSGATFRVHNFKVEYSPVLDVADMPECLQQPETTE